MGEKRHQTTVLLIDDNETVLDVVGLLLAQRDYTVLTARDACEAEQIWSQNRGRINAVVSDKWLNEKENSSRLLNSFQKDEPNVPIILMTGYPHQDENARQGFNYLPKPFSPSELFKALDAMLTP
jgi:DNA-binding NtrC family response regulator